MDLILLAQEAANVPAIPEPAGWISALIGASPPMAFCLFLVFMFLKYQKDREEAAEKKHDERQVESMAFQKAQTETMKQCVSDCREVIKDNTIALRQNAEAIARHSRE